MNEREKQFREVLDGVKFALDDLSKHGISYSKELPEPVKDTIVMGVTLNITSKSSVLTELFKDYTVKQ